MQEGMCVTNSARMGGIGAAGLQTLERDASMTGIRARDVLTKEPRWIAATTTLGEAVRTLETAGVRHLPVLDEGALVGMLSGRDLRAALPPADAFSEDWESVAALLDKPVAVLMNERVHTVEADQDLKSVHALMLQQRVGAVVVLDRPSGSVVGVISYTDVLRALRDGLIEPDAR